MHYTDLMEHVAGYLRRIPFPFDCIVTLTDGAAAGEVSRILRSGVPQARVAIVTVINKGRDVKPFYTDLAPMLPRYDIIAHIHGKKSVFNRGATAGWLDYLLDCLLGSETTVRKILGRFEEDEKTGLIYPAIFPGLPYWANSWLCNRSWAARLGERLQLAELPQGFFSFPAGNMFWARTAALEPLLNLGLSENDYPEEKGQTDGEIMHALERLVSVASRAHGFTNYVIRPTTDGIELKDDRDGIDFSVYHHRSLDYLRQRIDKPDIRVVSFDIFDTLIVRALADPADIFDLMQPAAERLAGYPVDFRRIRAEADGWLRERLEPGKDVTLKEIYDRVGDVLRLAETDREQLLQLELALEIKFTRSRPDVVAVMNDAYDRGKQVILTSDMYLDRAFVVKMLRRLGIVRYHRMYLSSEVGKRKDTRTLFPHILEAEGVRVDEMIHIGDNEHTDLQIPGDLGIHWFHVMRPLELYHQTALGKTGFPHRDGRRLSTFARVSFGLMLAKIFNDPFPKNPSPVNGDLHDFGYWYFGPVLLAYVKWALDRAREDGIDTLYFVSRDGDVLVRICRLLTEQLPGPTPKAVYLEVSRRSIGVPFIESREQLDKLLMPEYLIGPLSELIRIRLGIDLADCPAIDVQSYGFAGIDAPVSIPDDLFRIRQLCYALLENCRTHFSGEQECCLGYLREAGLFDAGKKAVVDIGYSGTLQRILNDVTGRAGGNVEPVHGYYMVLYDTFDTLVRNPAVRATGLFGDRIDPKLKKLSIDKYSLFYEMILSSVRGPVCCYTQKPDGAHRPVYAPVSTDEKYKLMKLPIVHEGILHYCRDLMELTDVAAITADDADFLLTPFQTFLEAPTQADLDMLAGYSLDDDYCGQKILYWAPPPGAGALSQADFLWKRYVPAAPLWFEKPAPAIRPAFGGFATRKEYEIFTWYREQYESLPGWYKAVGQLLKVIRGTKRIRL